MQATNEDKALEILRLIFSGRLDKENSKAVKQVADIIGRKSPHCNYMPHTIECAKFAGHKIIETGSGKEFYCCSEHLKNYRGYNERANREVFVIVF